MYGHILTDLC